MSIMDTILRTSQLLLARRSLQRFNNLLFWTAIGGMGLGLYDPSQKDERRLLRKLRIRLGKHPVVFDIGANIGQYAKMVREEYPDAIIHSFEPSPAAFRRLARLAEALHFTAVNMACGESIGAGVLFDRTAEGGSQHATLIPGIIESVHQSATLSKQQVPMTTIDVHMAEKDVDYLHLLKIDVEGFELEVLRGAEEAIRDKRIGVVQFEFNEMNLLSRTFMHDFEALLRGYHLYRLLHTGELLSLSTEPEVKKNIFAYQNIVGFPE